MMPFLFYRKCFTARNDFCQGGISMKIIQKISVKQVITELSKQKMHEKFTAERDQLDLECQQLLFEQRKLKNKYSSSDQEIRKRFDEEIGNRTKQIELIEFQLEQLEILEVGSEILEQEVHGLVDVNVGDNWQNISTEQSIVIKDDVVIKIEED